jgi:hypothetical protein
MATQRLTTSRLRSVISAGVIPIAALLVGATSSTVGILASAPEAFARQTSARQTSVRQASARQAPVSVVSCNNVIASARKPDSEERLVLGSFGAPPERIQRAQTGPVNGWQYFAKSGVEIKAGVGPVTVSVATADRDRVAISWGNGLAVVQAQRFAPCGSSARPWHAYAGGFYLRSRTACISLVIKVGPGSKTIRVGVGKSCT